MKIDIYASFRNWPSTFEVKEFYGYVEYFFVHKFDNTSRIMAYLEWTNEVFEDKFGLKWFRGFGTKQFIDVCVIDRCVGFLKCGSIYYIIDKEVNDLDLYLDSESEEND